MSVTIQALNPGDVHEHDGVSYCRPFPDLEANWHNGGARAVLDLLGLASPYLAGECTIANARRAVIRARATFARKAPQLTQEPQVIHGRPRERQDGTVELRPVRAVIGGIDEASLVRRLEQFADLTERAAERGAEVLTWG